MDRTVLGDRRRKPLSLAGAKAYLEPDEVMCLEKSITSLRDRLLIRLLFRLRCRISEALHITGEDIDLVKGTVTIRHPEGWKQYPYLPDPTTGSAWAGQQWLE